MRIRISILFTCLLLLMLGCKDSDIWVEAELDGITCNSNLSTIFSYNNSTGTITAAADPNGNTFYIKVNNPDILQVTEYCLPCNLPEEYNKENLQIRFNGDLKSMAGVIQEPGEEILITAQPVTLTRLWVME